MKFLNHDKVLVLSPHPDDAEYSMAGTIFKYTDTKFTIVNISSGGDHDPSTSPQRLVEATKFWNGISNVEIVSGSMKFVKDVAEDELVAMIDGFLGSHTAILVPPGDDHHFEHRLVSQAGKAATRRTKTSLIEYFTPSSDHTWSPNLFVDVGPFYKEKKARLACFVSQQGRTYFDNDSLYSFHANYFCSKRGVGLVESFKIGYAFN